MAGYFNLSLNITNLTVADVKFSQNVSLVQLHDDYLFLDIRDISLNASTKYGYILDPPILADLGDLYVDIANFTLFANITADYYDDGLYISLAKLIIDFLGMDLFMDGYSDLSVAVTNILEKAVGFL